MRLSVHVAPGWCRPSASTTGYPLAGNALRITVSEIERLLREFQESGATLRHRLETMPDGSREFGVVDPDGFHLEFVTRPVLVQDAPALATPA